jgi:hypothetical protein
VKYVYLLVIVKLWIWVVSKSDSIIIFVVQNMDDAVKAYEYSTDGMTSLGENTSSSNYNTGQV